MSVPHETHAIKNGVVKTERIPPGQDLESLAKIKKQLATQLGKKVQTMETKQMVKRPTGLACTEPCAFPRCLSSCLYEQDQEHQDHYCSDHHYRVRDLHQQPTMPLATDELEKRQFIKIGNPNRDAQVVKDQDGDNDSALDDGELLELASDSSDEDSEEESEGEKHRVR